MMSKKKRTGYGNRIVADGEIERSVLPAWERKGAIAQEISGELVLVTFHQTKIDVEYLTGLPASMDKKLIQVRPGISDTVFLGCRKSENEVFLLDIWMLSQRSQRGRPWRERLDLLQGLWGRFEVELSEWYPLARMRSQGLCGAFDAVVKNGGLGLYVRLASKPNGMLCLKQGAKNV